MLAPESGGVPVLAIDDKGEIIHANEAAGAFLEAEARLLEGQTLWSQLPEPEGARVREACDQAMKNDEIVELEVPWRREDRWHRIQAFPIEDNLAVHLLDITADKREHDELRLRERALREACEIVADRDARPRERIKRLLASIRATLGTEFATLSYVDPDQDAYHFDIVGDNNEETLPEGETVPLEELPICSRVAQAEQTLVLHDVEDQAPELVDPTWGLSAYIGSPVHVDGEVYGTFCFYSTERRSQAFTEWEVTLVELFSDFASAEFDRLTSDSGTIEPPVLSDPATP